MATATELTPAEQQQQEINRLRSHVVRLQTALRMLLESHDALAEISVVGSVAVWNAALHQARAVLSWSDR